MCVMCGCLTRAGGTTIVVIRTPDEVVIAADSAGTIRGDGLSATTESVCKVYELDSRFYFAVSGLVNDPQSGFNIPEIVAAADRDGGSLAARLARMEREVTDAVLRELPQLRKRDPKGYEEIVTSKGAVTVMLAGIDGGSPVATSFSLGLTRSANGMMETSITRDSCPGNCPSGVRAFWFGEGGAIERLCDGGAMPKLGMPELARYLVQAEIDARAPNVAGPIDVLRVLSQGPQWVQRKQSCPARVQLGMR